MKMKEKIAIITELLRSWEKNKKSYNMVDLFNTDEMDSIQIVVFLEDANRDFDFHYFFINKMIEDTKKEYELYKNIQQDIRGILYYAQDYSKYLSFLRRYLRCFCAFMIIYEKANDGSPLLSSTLNANAIDDFMTNYDYIDSYMKYYYRGQTNFEWDLIPSLFRNYVFRNGNQGDFIDSKMLLNIYEKEDLIDKYDKTIGTEMHGKKIPLKSAGITYSFLAYMQHSVSFSPMIDFTDKKEIASTFALGNKNDFNSFASFDSSIFKLGIMNEFFNGPETERRHNELNNENEINDFFKNDYRIKVLNGKIKLGTKMILAKSDYSTITIDCTSIKNIIKELKPDYKVISIATNDRMKYQHGKFLVFYNCLIVNGRIFFNLNRDISIEKIQIPKRAKRGFYNFLTKNYNHYNMEYLLNPYLYFSK
ncbi:MAG: FRG domain-containing protein [Acholeplasmatales bacterium]|nr:FRG domain-containing protein [Acholeplasmatales bacterium]